MSARSFILVGCGRIGERHADIISSGSDLVAAVDVRKDRLDLFAEKFGCKTFLSIEECFGKSIEADVVSVCTPNGYHAQHSILAVESGYHVLCEKPMATTVSDCQKMIDAAEKASKHLFIVKQNRFNPPIAALKKVIVDGKLGRIVDVQLNCFWHRDNRYYDESDWKGSADLDGGVLFTQFSHFIDLLHWMLGDVRHVHSLSRNFLHESSIDFEDTGVVILEFANSALGTINYTINSHSKNYEGSITVFGERGTVKVGGQYLNTLEYQDIEGYEISGLEQSRAANDYGFYQGSMSNHDKVYENVLEVLDNNGTIATSGMEGLKTVETIERIYSSTKATPVESADGKRAASA